MIQEIVQYSNTEYDPLGILAMIMSFTLIFAIAGFLFSFLLAWLVYRDATNNNDPNALMWGIIVFFSSFLGIILYFIVKSRNPPRPYQRDQEYVPVVPRPQPSAAGTGFCPNCGARVGSSSSFCPGCGGKL